MRTTEALAITALAVLAGCPPQPPSDQRGALDPSYFRGGAGADGADFASRPFSAEEKAQSRGKLGGIWISCYTTFQPTGDVPADLARLTSACGRPTGLAALTPVRTGESQSQQDPVERWSFSARAGRCYRFFSVAGVEVSDLDVAVLDPDGALAASDVSRDRWPVVPARGPLCVEKEGVYTVEVSVAQGSGAYALQVWTGE